jgi:hypothetical protein
MTANKLYFENVKEGDEVPSFEVKNLTRTDIVKYAALPGLQPDSPRSDAPPRRRAIRRSLRTAC